MPYSPSRPVGIKSIEDLASYVDDELRKISQALNEQIAVDLRPIYRAPDKPREGMLIFADGTSFNPGSGAGTYEYKGGIWVKLF